MTANKLKVFLFIFRFISSWNKRLALYRGIHSKLDNYFYSDALLSLRAFPITDTELKLIAAAAKIGLSRRPKAG